MTGAGQHVVDGLKRFGRNGSRDVRNSVARFHNVLTDVATVAVKIHFVSVLPVGIHGAGIERATQLKEDDSKKNDAYLQQILY